MTARRHILVYGAGAIGRGYIPWVFRPHDYDISYVERDQGLRAALLQAGKFPTYRTAGARYETLEVPVRACYAPGEEQAILKDIDVVITAVGPRNILAISEQLHNTRMPIICFENDPASAEILRGITGNPGVVFGIPDVITSNTASPDLGAKDPLAIITESGTCYVDERARSAGGDCSYLSHEQLSKQWLAKLYLHNTPHCTAAYLGSRIGVRYIHEAMQDGSVRRVVEGAMEEMKETLKKSSNLERSFIDQYAEKELSRFSNMLLYDPVSRVAREPFRKLAPDERLIGAAQLCISTGTLPVYISVGIMAAFFYDDVKDPDTHIRHLIGALKPEEFLRIVMLLDSHQALHRYLLRVWDDNRSFLSELSK